MGNMKLANYIIAGVGILVSAAMIALALALPVSPGTGDPGAGFWPLILGALLMGLSVLLLIVSIADRKRLANKTFTLYLPANRRVYVTIALLIAFCIVLYTLGFYGAALLFIPAIMWILEERRIKVIAATTVLTVGGIWLIFGILLHIQLPMPVFM